MAVEQKSIQPANGLDWATFSKSEQWHNLTAKQQMFLLNYLSTGDGLMATRAAFKSSDKNLRNMMWKTLRNEYVKAALDLWKNRSERETFLDELKAEIAASEEGSVAKARNMALYAKLRFGASEDESAVETDTSKNSAEHAPRFKIGDVVVQRGVRFRATRVSVEGRVLEAEEIV